MGYENIGHGRTKPAVSPKRLKIERKLLLNGLYKSSMRLSPKYRRSLTPHMARRTTLTYAAGSQVIGLYVAQSNHRPVTSMQRRFSVVLLRCVLVLAACAHYTASDVTDDVTDDDVSRESGRRSRGGGGGGVCPRCATHEALHQLPQADIVRLHVERIKREMLRKLGLSAAPNVTGIPLPSFHSLPPPILSARVENPGDDVTDEDGVFPDDDVDLSAAMADDAGSPGQEYDDEDDYSDDDDDEEEEEEDDYDDDDDDEEEDNFEGELDDDDAELGLPGPPPRTKQIIVFGQQRMSIVDCF